MLTTCPECSTSFRVTQEHLGLRRGLVRCGQCGVVFNAYDSLLAELLPPQGEETAVEIVEEITIPPVAEQAQPTDADQTAAAESEQPPPAVLSLAIPRQPPAAPRETADSIVQTELPEQTQQPSTGWPLPVQLVLAALLFALLLLQGAYFLRAEIAAANPDLRPVLQALCQPLECEVPLPQQLDKTAIAASSLEHDGENRTRTRLAILLANRTGQTQAWPHVILILTDLRDMPVAQKVFTPRDYLAQEVSLEAGMAAGEEQEIRLDLDTGPLAATGYALDLAYR